MSLALDGIEAILNRDGGTLRKPLLMQARAKTPTLTCGLLPGESRAVVEHLNEPLRLHLEHCLGMNVKLVVGSNYVATGEALRRGQLDLAYLGPVTYILQSRSAALEPFARPTHAGSAGPTFHSVIIVPADSPAQTLSNLRGAEIAMGDLVSTSGAWVPRHMLLEAGLVLGHDYVRRTLGAHDAVANAVARREFGAGALSWSVLRRLLAEHRINGRAIRILAESRPIPEYMWTFREGLPDTLRADVRQAFLSVKSREALNVFQAEAFIPAVDADVDRVRHWMENILLSHPTPVSLGCFAEQTRPLSRRVRHAPERGEVERVGEPS